MQFAARLTARSLGFIVAYEAAIAILADGTGLGTAWFMAIFWHLPLALAMLIHNRALVAPLCAGAHLSIFAALLSALQVGPPSGPNLATKEVLWAAITGLSYPVLRAANGGHYPADGRGGPIILVVVGVGAALFAAAGAGFSWSIRAPADGQGARRPAPPEE